MHLHIFVQSRQNNICSRIFPYSPRRPRFHIFEAFLRFPEFHSPSSEVRPRSPNDWIRSGAVVYADQSSNRYTCMHNRMHLHRVDTMNIHAHTNTADLYRSSRNAALHEDHTQHEVNSTGIRDTHSYTSSASRRKIVSSIASPKQLRPQSYRHHSVGLLCVVGMSRLKGENAQ